MLLLILKTSITILILAIGMTATKNEIIYLWRRPALLLKSIIAMYVVMPAITVLMLWMLNLPPRTEIALVILAICAGTPLLPKKLIKLGGDPIGVPTPPILHPYMMPSINMTFIRRVSSFSQMASAIGNNINAVATLEIHMLSTAAATMNPSTSCRPA